MGKETLVYNEDTTPWNYRFLPGANAIVHTLPELEQFDAIFVLDCSELERVGEQAGRIAAARCLINIDHHLSNAGFADLQLIDAEASSTAEIIFRLLERMGATATKDIATNLYAAILTDTGGFRYASTSAQTLAIGGGLVASGADPACIGEHIYDDSPLARVRLLALTLATLCIELDGTVGSLVVSQAALAEVNAQLEHTDGFVDYPRSIHGVRVSVLYTETGEKCWKVSLRSKGCWNVERVARACGGGGHLNAAACRLTGTLAEVRARVLAQIAAAMVVP